MLTNETFRSIAESNRTYLMHCPEGNLNETLYENDHLMNIDEFLNVQYVQSRSQCRSSDNDDHVLYQHIVLNIANASEVMTKLFLYMKTDSGLILQENGTELYMISNSNPLICKICNDGCVFYGTQRFVRSFTIDAAHAKYLLDSGKQQIEESIARRKNFDALCV